MRQGKLDLARSNNATACRYLRVGNFYVNSRLTLPRLGHYLWRQFEQFLGSEGKTRLLPTRLSRLLPPPAVKAARVARFLARFFMARVQHALRNDARPLSAIELPVPGDFAIVRKSGAIKVLDASNGVVYTFMGHEDSDKLRARVEMSKEISRFPFAPKIRQVDLNGGYFSEEFITGSHPINFEGCGDDFVEVYQPLLVEFLRAVPPSWRPLSDYARSLKDDILARDGLLMRLEPGARRPVAEFVEEISGRLEGLEEDIPLVLSHGDYFSGNIVIDGSAYRAIDWANMGYRSPLHDLYYLQMNHCRRVLDHRSLQRQTRVTIRRLSDELRGRDAILFDELSPALTSRAEYRWLFYLECIQVPLLRCDSPHDRYLTSMLVRVSWFVDFERAVAGENVPGRVAPSAAGRTAIRPSGAGNR
jgi:hypothetical protein